MKLKSDIGGYSISIYNLLSLRPQKIQRQRQLINLDDYQGKGQFGILDKYESGHRICYNQVPSIYLDKCFELDQTAYSYDFVFIEKDTIAVSKIRLSDNYFGVTIYQNQEIISDYYFIPSKTYQDVNQTIIEFCQFGQKQYLLLGITDIDSNIEYLEIQSHYQIINTNNFIDKSLIPIAAQLQLLNMKGCNNKIIIVFKNQNQQIILNLFYNDKWSSDTSYYITSQLRALELGYNLIQSQLNQTVLQCEQNYCCLTSSNGCYFINYLQTQIKINSQVKYTLNYLIILQDNVLIISNLHKLNQRTHIIEGIILNIDVDFQNDLVFIFQESKILEYFLKPSTIQFSSKIVTDTLDLVTIQSLSSDLEQNANIHFQVLAKDDYNLYQLKSLTKDLYFNEAFYSPINIFPINGMSGPDIRVSAYVDNQVKIISHGYQEHEIKLFESQEIIQESLISDDDNNLYVIRQFQDFSLKMYMCLLEMKNYCNQYDEITIYELKVYFKSQQKQQSRVEFALMSSDGRRIDIYYYFNQILTITAQDWNFFATIRIGTDRLFTYTIKDDIEFYYYPSGQLMTKFNLQLFGNKKGISQRNLWVNQVKSNLLIIQYGNDLLIGRFTSQFLLIQRLNIKLVHDVSIISDDKIIILYAEDETNKLIQLTLKDGLFKIQKYLDIHGYAISNTLLTDYENSKIMISASKDKQNALLVFGDTELSRDSLLKVIPLKDNETIVSVISYNQNSLILKSESQFAFSIIEIQYLNQAVEINLGEIHNKFSQQLDLIYSFSNSFSPEAFQVLKYFYLEYHFSNITTLYNTTKKISYKNQNQLQIAIKEDTFQGQVSNYYISSQYDKHLKLTTRIKINKLLVGIPASSDCKKLTRFQRLFCTNIYEKYVTYHDLNGKLISSVYTQLIVRQFILSMDEQYSQLKFHKIGLVSQEVLELFEIEISIFYKGWFVNYAQSQEYLSYYQISPQNVDVWFEKKYEYFIKDIKGIQYDPETKQIFYQTVLIRRYKIDKKPVFSINMASFLKTQNIYQLNTTISNIHVKNSWEKSFLFVSTSYGNILNMTIESEQQKFQVNSVQIANGGSNVHNIKMIDDYVIIQIGYQQFLYKNNNNWVSQIPNLSLERIGTNYFMELYKNGSEIVYLFQDYENYCQAQIDDNIYIIINNLTTYTPGVIKIGAQNEFGKASIQFQIIKIEGLSLYIWMWILSGIIAVIAIIGGAFYCYKKRQSVNPLLG
ncbi:hypothetical protein pb186bvf_020523 [Paramecium bursaria]